MSTQRLRPRGWMQGYFKIPLQLGLLMILADILIFLVDYRCGLVLLLLLAVYLGICIWIYTNHRLLLHKELLTFAEEYGLVQGRLMRDMDLPYALLDIEGHIVWMNNAFSKIVHKGTGYNKSITSLFPTIQRDSLPSEGEEACVSVDFEAESYIAKMTLLPLTGISRNSSYFDYTGQEALITLALSDNTAVRLALKEVDDQSLAVGFIYIDNYEEAMETMEDVRRSLLAALIDRKVSQYVLSYDGISGKVEKDKYLIILRKKSLLQMQEDHFPLIEEAKKVNIGNKMAITLSIGIGLDGLSYNQNYEFARNAVDVALGRGGDQAVVKTPQNITYYGGKTQTVEKSTKVRARVKAQALKEIITSRDTVYIMGHRLGDPDSFGAAIGIYRVAKYLKHRAYIVINEKTTSLKQILTLFENNPEYESDMILTSQEAVNQVTENAVLVVVDVSKPSITECPELLKICKTVVVIDHHRKGTESIENATLSYIEPYASSACEMVSEIIQYTADDIEITPEEADALYGGIVVDTDNFLNRTGVRTFEAAAFLRRSGADVTRVRKLFREEAADYKARADIITQVEVYRDCYAISVNDGEGQKSPTVVGAQAANEMLSIKGIRASFVFTSYQEKIFVSARSIDDVNVQRVMENMGGGGHMTIAGCQVNMPVADAIALLKHTIDQMIEEGEL